MRRLPECSPCDEGKQNTQVPHALQRYTVLCRQLHPTPNVTHNQIKMSSKQPSTYTSESNVLSFFRTNLNCLVISTSYKRKLLTGMSKCNIINTANMSINLRIECSKKPSIRINRESSAFKDESRFPNLQMLPDIITTMIRVYLDNVPRISNTYAMVME